MKPYSKLLGSITALLERTQLLLEAAVKCLLPYPGGCSASCVVCSYENTVASGSYSLPGVLSAHIGVCVQTMWQCE